MPFKKITELPANIQKLPEPKQKQWLSVWNKAYAKAVDDGKELKQAEQVAFRQANGVVLTEFNIHIKLDESNLKEVKLLYVGEFKHDNYGEFEVTQDHIDQAEKNFNEGISLRGDGSLPFNYNHYKSNFDTDPEISKASGWIRGVVKRGAELFGLTDFTDKAIEYIKSKEFRFISPEFTFDFKDENGSNHGFTLKGAALTNVNFLKKGMPAIALMENGDYIECGDLLDDMQKIPIQNALHDTVFNLHKLMDFLHRQIDKDKIESLDSLQNSISDNMNDVFEMMGKDFDRNVMLDVINFVEMKTEGGEKFPAEAFLFTPDLKKPSTWKLRTWESVEKKMTGAQLNKAAKNINKIPSDDQSKIKGLLRGLYNRQKIEIPKFLQLNEVFDMENQDKFIEILNLDEGQDVFEAVKSLTEKNATLEKDLQGLKEKDVKLTETEKANKELSEKVTKLTDKVDTMKSDIALKEAEDIVHGYVENGILPTDEDTKKFWIDAYLTDAEKAVGQLDRMEKVIPQGFTGSNSAEGRKTVDGDVTVKFNDGIKKIMTDKKVEYKVAQDILMTEQPDLWKKYNDLTEE